MKEAACRAIATQIFFEVDLFTSFQQANILPSKRKCIYLYSEVVYLDVWIRKFATYETCHVNSTQPMGIRVLDFL